MFFWLSLVIFIASFTGLVIIFARHFTQLAILNPDTIKKPEFKMRKDQLLEERMRRFWHDRARLVIRLVRYIIKFVKPKLQILWSRILELERALEKTKSRVSATVIAKKEKINALIEAGYNALEKGDPATAEGKFIEAIRIDPRAAEVYKGLAEVYVARKSFAEAQESLEFAAKLAPHDVGIYRQLTNIAEAAGERAKLLEYLSKLIELEPSNPKHLDLLVETAIMLGNKRLARQGLSRLLAVNPENKKIGEFEARILDIRN